MEPIVYKLNVIPEVAAIIEVYNASGINRPTHDVDRIKKMYANSNLVITAWEQEKLVGIARAMTDFCYACYLSDLAVHANYQRFGIGKKLISYVQNEIGEETTFVLLSAPSAMEYYPKAGFTKAENAFFIKRKK